MKKTDLMKEVRTALDATYYYQSNASSVSIKVATTQQPFAHVVANAMAVAEKLVAKHIPGRWANIRMVGIKTRHSVTLPVYNNVADVENDDAVPVAAQGAGTTAKAAIVNDVTELQGKLADDTLTEAQRAKLKRKLEQAESKQEVRSFLKDLSKKIKLKGVVL